MLEKTLYEIYLEENYIQRSLNLGMGYEWYGESITTLVRGGRIQDAKNHRDVCVSRFSFAILTRAVVKCLLTHGPFLEIGCGTGYWAYELMKAGSNSTETIIATDPEPLSGCRAKAEKIYLPIDRINATQAIEKYGCERTLLTVWPSYDEPWAANALERYLEGGGKKVAYVGEGHGGCTADDRFHEILDEKWYEIDSIELPQWFGIHDTLTIYERKV